MTHHRCRECRYFVSTDSDRRFGECHRETPQPDLRPAANHQGFWPQVSAYNWCGRYARSCAAERRTNPALQAAAAMGDAERRSP